MISIVPYQSAEYQEMVLLRNEILRKPLGLVLTAEDLEKEEKDLFMIYKQDEQLAGCCILTRQTDFVVKLRQMAVSLSYQGTGIGIQMLQFAEKTAWKSGYTQMILHARKTAEGFYEKAGFVRNGEEFVEVGITHVCMEKGL